MTAPLLATRIRKARARSVCGLCPDIIRIGNPIGRVPGRGWCHTGCIVQHNRQAERDALAAAAEALSNSTTQEDT